MSQCNVCGCAEWTNQGARIGVRCVSCGSLERTRLIKLFIDKVWQPKEDSRIFHMAPERALYEHLKSLKIAQYRATDFSPENFRFGDIEQMDLCRDAPGLPSDTYDLIIHAHVMEHLPCNVTAVLSHIHRSLKPGGLHLFCIPIMRGHSGEDLAPLSPEEANRRFGQGDHVRKFGKEDVARNLGMVFKLPPSYAMTDYFSASVLKEHNIPESHWMGYTGTAVFPLKKADYLL